MTYDFRANQVRTNKIIASGSTGTNAALLIYPFASALNQSGSINTSVFATGSIGTDVFLFVSGAVNSMGTAVSGTSVFGGDLKVSGAFMVINTASFSGPVTASNALVVTGKLSGSLQTLTNGTPFLKAGPNITIVTESNGAVAISGSAGSSYTMQSWIDFQRQRYAIYPDEAGGDYTIGTKFLTTVSGASITGYRFAWGGSVDKVLMVTVWSGTVGVVSASVPVSAASPGIFTGSFSTPVSMAPYRDYYISYRDQSGTHFYAYTSGNDFYFFAGTGTNKAARVLPNLIVGYFYSYAVGNSAPTSVSADNYSSAVEPIITFA